MSLVYDVEVGPEFRIRLHFCDPLPITGFVRLSGDEWPPLPIPANELEMITTACSHACGRQLYLWDWELRSCGTLAFHFRLTPRHPDAPTWAETVERNAHLAQPEPQPKQQDLFGAEQ